MPRCTIRPLSSTTISSASLIVLSRWATIRRFKVITVSLAAVFFVGWLANACWGRPTGKALQWGEKRFKGPGYTLEAQCMWRDSDGNGYRSCDLFATGPDGKNTTVQLECHNWDGCKKKVIHGVAPASQ